LIFEKPLGEEDLYIREIVNYLHCEQGSVLFSASVYASAYFQRFLSVVIRLQSFPACSSTRNTGYDQFTPVSKRGRSKLWLWITYLTKYLICGFWLGGI